MISVHQAALEHDFDTKAIGKFYNSILCSIDSCVNISFQNGFSCPMGLCKAFLQYLLLIGVIAFTRYRGCVEWLFFNR